MSDQINTTEPAPPAEKLDRGPRADAERSCETGRAEPGPVPTAGGGWKADSWKPRPDLLAWDVVNPALEFFDPETPGFPTSPAQLKHELWQIMGDLRMWFHKVDPVASKQNLLTKAFYRALVLLGSTIPGRAVDTDLAPAVMAVADVLGFGARKYADRNWEMGIRYSRVYAAALRHGYAVQSGIERDAETQLHHLAHFACCVMFLAAFIERRMGSLWDDRDLAVAP